MEGDRVDREQCYNRNCNAHNDHVNIGIERKRKHKRPWDIASLRVAKTAVYAISRVQSTRRSIRI